MASSVEVNREERREEAPAHVGNSISREIIVADGWNKF